MLRLSRSSRPAAQAAATLLAPMAALSSASLCASQQNVQTPNAKVSPKLKMASAGATAALSAGASAFLVGTSPAAAGAAAGISAFAFANALGAAGPLLLRLLPAQARAADRQPLSSPIGLVSRSVASQSQQINFLALAPSLAFVLRSIITPVPSLPRALSVSGSTGVPGSNSSFRSSSRDGSHRHSMATKVPAKQPRCSMAARKRRRVTARIINVFR